MFISFLLVRSASVSSSRVRYFSSISVKVRAFLHLDVVKPVVSSAYYTGIRTYIIVSIAGLGKLQCYGIHMWGCYTTFFHT